MRFTERLWDLLARREDARWGFAVMQGQVPVINIIVTSHGRNHAAIEVATLKKYPEVLVYGGTEIIIRPSGFTRDEDLDTALPVGTCIMWPARWRGWDVIPEHSGRYELRFVLLRPGRRRHSCPVEVVSEDERVKRILAGDR